MREVRIHFENKVVVISDRPFETMDISRAKSQFPMTLLQEKLAGISHLKLLDNAGCAIGRAVINHQNMIPLPQLKDGFYDIGDIFPFVKSRYDDDLFQMA